ncbi:SMC-Scp complex subunit ScpB [Gammaproteobacteria bacterium]|jgi:segregation and condensation protein B|nr:SMC-Scp complex subunit ScpB [Gammaproteobacteria bacterium]
MDAVEIKHFIEAALLAAGRPLSVDQLQNLFDGRMAPAKKDIRAAVAALNDEYKDRGIIVAEVASGLRVQVKPAMANQLQKLWEDRPPRYSRALFETLALIAYRQPITRGEIEEVRGVSVSSNIVRSLLERDWVRVVGHRDVPGRPEMFGTTKTFLDYFGLMKLDDLPPLADLADWENLRVQLNLPEVDEDLTSELADVTQLPTLSPQVGEGDGDPEQNSEVIGNSDLNDHDIPDLESITTSAHVNLDELVVTEWPDPTDSGSEVSVDSDDEEDLETSATSG